MNNKTIRFSVRLASHLVLGITFVFLIAQPAFAQPDNVTLQLPVLGVSVDADGVLATKLFQDPKNGQLMLKRLAEGGINRVGNLKKAAEMRKVSLRRLEAHVQEQLAAGKDLTDEMLSLAGLTRVEYVFVYPEQNDIVIAGPAEPWVKNLGGRPIGLVSGQPTLMLEDLIVALRIYQPKKKAQAPVNTWVACSIDPTAAGIERLKEFQKKMPKRVSENQKAQAAIELAAGLQRSLGNSDIKVYGISNKTHMAQVMVEADYRMKLIGMGLEPAPVKMQTFIGALKGGSGDMQRWWFVPNYKCVRADVDELAIQLVGDGVNLSTERIDIDAQGNVIQLKKKASSASRSYAKSFTKKYPEISKASPVYSQLRQVIDLLVACAWMKKTNAFEKAEWDPQLFLNEELMPVETLPAPTKCPSAANADWKGSTLVLPSGGVSIQAEKALEKDNIQIEEAGIARTPRRKIDIERDAKRYVVVGLSFRWLAIAPLIDIELQDEKATERLADLLKEENQTERISFRERQIWFTLFESANQSIEHGLLIQLIG